MAARASAVAGSDLRADPFVDPFVDPSVNSGALRRHVRLTYGYDTDIR